MAVVGAGWAGIAAAVHARGAGHEVQLFEMAAQAGGRARTAGGAAAAFDNGQHILIGAYSATLELMRRVGADPAALLHRLPLVLRYPDGHGLQLRPGRPGRAFVRAVAARRGWTWADRASLLRHAGAWALRRFHCDDALSVAQLCARLAPSVRRELIEPLCVAALNTPSDAASARVFLRVLHDALFGGPGSSDLLLPAAPLDALLPQPALAWLAARGVAYRPGTRVLQLQRDGGGWRVDGQLFDAVILACSAREAARLCAAVAPAWAATALALRYEPIATVYLRCAGARLPLPMVALACGPEAPAQFAFDLGALGSAEATFAFAISGARAWVERGLPALARATLQQARHAFQAGTWPDAPTVLHVTAEKRATFLCTPGLRRPAAAVAPGLWAAGDYVDGPYPATLEGAVRAGRFAASRLDLPSMAG